jgi:WD40 repeat protein
MNTFEITVQRRTAGGWPVVAEQTASGVFLRVRTEGLLQADLEELKAQLLSQPTARDYGTLLGRALFRDDVRDAFVQALPRGDDRLHVLLFVEDADLKGMRWERLCAPLSGGWDFLALNQRVPYSLYLPSTTDQRFPPIGRSDLRALVVVANPRGLEKYRLAPFDEAGTVAGVRTNLGSIPADVLAAVPGAAGPATLDALCERITAERYTLLHVVAHGQFKPADRETVLYLANADNQTEPVPAARLLGRLKQLRGLPHFAFLSACESAVAEAGPALGGLAQRLVGELGMPAVLAMTEKVSVATAQALGEAFYRRLRETGAPDRALVEACAALAGRYDVNVPALYSRLGGRPLFGDTPDRPLTVAEIREGLTRARALLQERAPVWLEARADRPRPVFEEAAARLEADLHAEVKDLSEQARKDRVQALDEVGNLCAEALERNFTELALGKEPPPYDRRCPFRGLYPFRAADREFFFGREALVGRLADRLAESDFLAVLGPSGSGKSSVVLGGLVPALETREANLRPAYMTPGSDPLDFLEAVLQAEDRASLLVVDQFEELFTLCADDVKRRAFLDRLLKLPGQTRVVLTMRADFWGECAPYRELKDLMQARQELIAPMGAGELRRAMEMQAAKVGLRFEADLSSTILDDVEGEPGAMPLLQHALLELWKRRHGRWLRADEYRRLGGVKQAIARTAEDLYGGLPPEDRERVRDVFVRLTRLDDRDAAGGRRDTRQRVRLEDLVPQGSDPAHTKALLKRLADARLIVTGVNAATGREEVEVAHEALLRHWERFGGWVEEGRAQLVLRDALGRAAREWEGTGPAGRRDDGLLWRGRRLGEAEDLLREGRLPTTELEKEFVRAGVGQREQEAGAARRVRWLLRVAAAGIGVLFLVAWYLEHQSAEVKKKADEDEIKHNKAIAEEQSKRAETERQARTRIEREIRVAQARQLAADSGASLERYPQRALLLAAAAVGATAAGEPHEPRAEQALRDALGQVGGVPLGDPAAAAPAVLRAVSPDLRWAVTTFGEVAHLWDLSARAAAGQSRPALAAELPAGKWLSRVAFSPDARWLLLEGQGGPSRLYRTAGAGVRESELELRRPGAELLPASVFSPDCRWLACDAGGKDALLWYLGGEKPSPKPRRLAVNLNDPDVVGPLAVQFSPDSRWLCTWRSSAGVLWDLKDPAAVAGPSPVLRGEESTGWVEFSPDSAWLSATPQKSHRPATWGPERPCLWDLRGDAPTFKLLPLDTDFWAGRLRFGPGGRYAVAQGMYDTTWVWDLTAKDPSGTRQRVQGRVEVSPDGRWLLAWDAKLRLYDWEGAGKAEIWDLTAAKLSPQPLGETEVRLAFFGPDSRPLGVFLGNDVQRKLLPRPREGPRTESLALVEKDGSLSLRKLTADGPDAGRTLVRGERGIRDVLISPGGRWVLALSEWFSPLLFDLEGRSGAPDYQLVGFPRTAADAMFAPDDSALLLGLESSPTLYYWDLTGKGPASFLRNRQDGKVFKEQRPGPANTLHGHEERVLEAAFVRGGQAVLTVDASRSARLRDLRRVDRALAPLAVNRELVSDGRWVVTVERDDARSPYIGVARWWGSVDDPTRPPLTLSAPGQDVLQLCASADRRWLLPRPRGGPLRLWDLSASPPASRELQDGLDQEVRRAVFSRDGRWLLTWRKQDGPRLWGLGGPGPAVEGHPLDAGPDGDLVEFSADGRWLVTAGRKGPVLWGLPGRAATPVAAENYQGQQAAFTPDGRWLFLSGKDTVGRLFDLGAARPGQPLQPSRRLEGATRGDPALSPDRRWLVAGAAKVWRLWDLCAAVPDVPACDLPAEVSSAYVANRRALAAGFSPNSRRLVLLDGKNVARVFLLDEGRPPPEVAVPGTCAGGVFSADGHWLAAVGADREVRLIDLTHFPNDQVTEKRLRGVIRETSPPSDPFLTFSGDGKWLAAAAPEGTYLWQTALEPDRAFPVVLPGMRGPFRFSPDGRWLATPSAEGENSPLHLWGLDLPRLRELARRTAGRDLTPQERAQFLFREGPDRDGER